MEGVRRIARAVRPPGTPATPAAPRRSPAGGVGDGRDRDATSSSTSPTCTSIFGGLHALADIDLQVEEGKTHAIIGPNGAGKSTLLNVIIGRLAPDTRRGGLRRPGADRQEAAPDQPDGRRPRVPDAGNLPRPDGAAERHDPGLRQARRRLQHQHLPARSTARPSIREEAEAHPRGCRPARAAATCMPAALSRGDKRRHGARDVPDPASAAAAARRADRRHVRATTPTPPSSCSRRSRRAA